MDQNQQQEQNPQQQVAPNETPPQTSQEPQSQPQRNDGDPSPTSDTDWEKRFKNQSRVLSQKDREIQSLRQQLQTMQQQYAQMMEGFKKIAGVDNTETPDAAPDPLAIAQQAVQEVQTLKQQLERERIERKKLEMLPPELHEFADLLPTPDDEGKLEEVVKAFSERMSKYVKNASKPKDKLNTPPAPQKPKNAEAQANDLLNKWQRATERGEWDKANDYYEQYLKVVGDDNPWATPDALFSPDLF